MRPTALTLSAITPASLRLSELIAGRALPLGRTGEKGSERRFHSAGRWTISANTPDSASLSGPRPDRQVFFRLKISPAVMLSGSESLDRAFRVHTRVKPVIRGGTSQGWPASAGDLRRAKHCRDLRTLSNSHTATSRTPPIKENVYVFLGKSSDDLRNQQLGVALRIK